MTENLWLNLSTGFVGSGRQNWDGSGGNGAALRHYEATGRKYPLCVKLGTITPHGADVFSYAGPRTAKKKLRCLQRCVVGAGSSFALRLLPLHPNLIALHFCAVACVEYNATPRLALLDPPFHLHGYLITNRLLTRCISLTHFHVAEDENDMVLDPLLAAHLSHWGINMMAMEKTEKTMAELQIDLNMSFEFDKITEAGSALEPLSGPGYVGLTNLGNSCYMNSVLQVRPLPGFPLGLLTASWWASADLTCSVTKGTGQIYSGTVSAQRLAAGAAANRLGSWLADCVVIVTCLPKVQLVHG